jgi:hypothetical protein
MCERCEELEETIRQLRQELIGRADITAVAVLQARFNLAPAPAKMLLALYQTMRPVSSAHLAFVGAGDGASYEAVKAHMARLRLRLGSDEVLSVRGSGYYALTQKARDMVTEALGSAVPAEALNDDSAPLPTALAVIAGRMAHEMGAKVTMTTLRNIHFALEKQYGPAPA